MYLQVITNSLQHGACTARNLVVRHSPVTVELSPFCFVSHFCLFMRQSMAGSNNHSPLSPVTSPIVFRFHFPNSAQETHNALSLVILPIVFRCHFPKFRPSNAQCPLPRHGKVTHPVPDAFPRSLDGRRPSLPPFSRHFRKVRIPGTRGAEPISGVPNFPCFCPAKYT